MEIQDAPPREFLHGLLLEFFQLLEIVRISHMKHTVVRAAKTVFRIRLHGFNHDSFGNLNGTGVMKRIQLLPLNLQDRLQL